LRVAKHLLGEEQRRGAATCASGAEGAQGWRYKARTHLGELLERQAEQRVVQREHGLERRAGVAGGLVHGGPLSLTAAALAAVVQSTTTPSTDGETGAALARHADNNAAKQRREATAEKSVCGGTLATGAQDSEGRDVGGGGGTAAICPAPPPKPC